MNKIALLGVLCAGCAAFLPLMIVKANRLLAGTALGIAAVPVTYWLLGVFFLALPVAWLKFKSRAVVLLVLGNFSLLALLLGLSIFSQNLGTNPISRVSPAFGYWLWLLAAWLLAYAGALELGRLWLAGLGLSAGLGLLVFGAFDSLSVLREYSANQSEFWTEVLHHLVLAFWAWVLSSLLGLVLGVYAASRVKISGVILGIANGLQTIPSIALFALLIPFFSTLARNIPWLETLGIRGIGFAPALTALTLYGLLPVLRGTILSLQNVPQAPLEAAQGLGLTDRQIFWQVHLPLAIPLLLEGLRLAAVSLVGLAALSSLIGAGGLGAFIFTGLGNGAIDRVLLGAIPTLLLAVLVNSGLRGLEFGLTPKGLK